LTLDHKEKRQRNGPSNRRGSPNTSFVAKAVDPSEGGKKRRTYEYGGGENVPYKEKES